GVELLVRRLGTRWSGSVGYTVGVSRMRAEVAEPDTLTFRYPAPADVRHAVDAMLRVRVTEALQLGGAFTFGSGVPYTRLILPPVGAGEEAVVRLGAPNAER